MKNKPMNIKVVDLFCGIGGLTHGLLKEGLDVVAGIDSDDTCQYGYEYNNNAKFIHKDILKVTTKEINNLFGNDVNTIRETIKALQPQNLIPIHTTMPEWFEKEYSKTKIVQNGNSITLQ